MFKVILIQIYKLGLGISFLQIKGLVIAKTCKTDSTISSVKENSSKVIISIDFSFFVLCSLVCLQESWSIQINAKKQVYQM